MVTVTDVSILALLYLPLVYIVVLGRRNQPAERLNALLRALIGFWK